jgi:hypothetical protein
MIIYHASGLHVRITDSRSDETKAALSQIFTHGLRLRCLGGQFAQILARVLDRFSARELPNIVVETAEFL